MNTEMKQLKDAVMMQMEDDEIEAEAAEEQEDSSGPRKIIWNHTKIRSNDIALKSSDHFGVRYSPNVLQSSRLKS